MSAQSSALAGVRVSMASASVRRCMLGPTVHLKHAAFARDMGLATVQIVFAMRAGKVHSVNKQCVAVRDMVPVWLALVPVSMAGAVRTAPGEFVITAVGKEPRDAMTDDVFALQDFQAALAILLNDRYSSEI